MDSGLHSDINFASYMCPNCHYATFYCHSMAEYNREWNKCSGCGYMERKTTTRARILNKWAPDQLTEPFIDPLTEIAEKSIYMCIHCKNVKKCNNSDNESNCSCDD